MKNFLTDMLPFVALFAMFTFARCEAQKKAPKAKMDMELAKTLDRDAHYIMVKRGTERAYSSPLNKEKRSGVYVSPATGDTLFVSTAKFNSGTGWPSFDDATDKVSLGPAEQGGYEVIEKSTGYHLGHLFQGEMFTNKNKRYCINGDALKFMPN